MEPDLQYLQAYLNNEEGLDNLGFPRMVKLLTFGLSEGEAWRADIGRVITSLEMYIDIDILLTKTCISESSCPIVKSDGPRSTKRSQPKTIVTSIL